MEQTVYIDILFIVNFFANYFLLISVKKVTRSDIKGYRPVIGSLLGAVYSVGLFFIEVNPVLLFLIKLLFAVSIVFVTFGRTSFKGFLKIICIFFTVNFLFAGLMLAFWFFIAPKGMEVNNGIVYFNISLPLLAVLTAVSYAAVTLIYKIYKKSRPPEVKTEILVKYKEREVQISAIVDTGNTLTELFSGFDVIVCEYSSIKELLPEELAKAFEGAILRQEFNAVTDNFRIIPCSTVSGGGILPSFRPDSVVIGEREIKDVYVAACESKVSKDGCKALINPNI